MEVQDGAKNKKRKNCKIKHNRDISSNINIANK